MLQPATSHAEPSIDDVEHRLDRLYQQAEQAQERIHLSTTRTKRARISLRALRADLREQHARFDRASDASAAMAAEQAQSVEAQLSATQRLVLADDANEFLDKLAAQEVLTNHQGTLLNELATQAARLHQRRRHVDQQLSLVTRQRRQTARQEETVDAKIAQAENVLSRLEAEHRAELRRQRLAAARQASRGLPRTPTVAATGHAAVVVDFALAQIGETYVYGADGPNSWDCSGLTMAAWAAAGVTLPRSSSSQAGAGTPVAMSELHPGDLVFYYQPVSHVGIYIGDGQIVHASNPRSPVGTAPVDSMPYSGAVRPG